MGYFVVLLSKSCSGTAEERTNVSNYPSLLSLLVCIAIAHDSCNLATCNIETEILNSYLNREVILLLPEAPELPKLPIVPVVPVFKPPKVLEQLTIPKLQTKNAVPETKNKMARIVSSTLTRNIFTPAKAAMIADLICEKMDNLELSN